MSPTEFIDNVEKRISSPFLFSFFVSWPLWNYRAMIVIFGNGTYIEKLSFLDWLYPTLYSSLEWKLFCPLFSALAYTFGWPFIDGYVSSWHQRLINRKQRRIFDVNKTETVAKEDQATYFDKNSKDLRDSQARTAGLAAELARSKSDAESTKSQFERRLARIALLNLTCECSLSVESIQSMLTLRNDYTSFGDSIFRLVQAIPLENVFKFAESAHVDENGRRYVSTAQIIQHTGYTDTQAAALVEIMRAGGVLRASDGDHVFEYFPHDGEMREAIRAIAKLQIAKQTIMP